MNCLVLGGNGFIGRHLCKALVAAGHDVNAFDLPPREGIGWPEIDNVNWYQGDFSSPADLAPLLDGCEAIFHLVSASLPASSNEDPLCDLQMNVAASLRLFDLLITRESPPKVVFASSGGTVYGVPVVVPIPETHPNNPLCAYGVGKLSIEKYLALYHHLHGLESCVLRLANPYGAHQSATGGQGVIAAFLARALNDQPLEVWGDGTVVRDYLHVDDVCAAFLKAMTYHGSERVFNVGSGHGVSLNELIVMMEELLGKTIVRRFFPGRDCDAPVNVLDIRRANESLDWSPRISLREGISQLLGQMKC